MRRLALFSAVLVFGGCGGDRAETSEALPEPVPPTVEIFLPGVVSSALPEFAISFTPSGDTAFFNRTPPDRSSLDLYIAVRIDGRWQPAELFAPTVGVRAVDPFVAADGTRLYFSSDRTAEGGSGEFFGLWYLERAGAVWSAPMPVALDGLTRSDVVFNSISDNGVMVFRADGEVERAIYSVQQRTDGGWTVPTMLRFGDVIDASNPAISPDGSMLVVSRRVGEDPPDLFLSCATGDGWSELIRLPDPVNSDFADFAPAFYRSDLFFTSERPGVAGPMADSIRPPGDIYRTSGEMVSARCVERGD